VCSVLGWMKYSAQIPNMGHHILATSHVTKNEDILKKMDNQTVVGPHFILCFCLTIPLN